MSPVGDSHSVWHTYVIDLARSDIIKYISVYKKQNLKNIIYSMDIG